MKAPGIERRPRRARLAAFDTALFLRINAAAHHPALDRLMSAVSRVILHGEVWVGVLLVGVIYEPIAGRVALIDVLPPLWLTTLVVNFGVKTLVGRPRPFVAEDDAVVIGHRPSDSSFPSGHTAAAFAGAWLLSRHYPGWAPAFYALAALVGWSRVYLGVHYPSDVALGAASGVGLAALFRWAIARIGIGGA